MRVVGIALRGSIVERARPNTNLEQALTGEDAHPSPVAAVPDEPDPASRKREDGSMIVERPGILGARAPGSTAPREVGARPIYAVELCPAKVGIGEVASAPCRHGYDVTFARADGTLCRLRQSRFDDSRDAEMIALTTVDSGLQFDAIQGSSSADTVTAPSHRTRCSRSPILRAPALGSGARCRAFSSAGTEARRGICSIRELLEY
ncbi:hypothetical protein LZC94_07950 [Pendulispora albinea]|uniref:Uncharacterized protein n=1 Tax=Pendulispora albinea TaxID=2741071 RepID=A0ABZ2M3T8_9BACT